MPKKPLALKFFDIASVVLLVIGTILVFFYAETEANMGMVQRVFYFHVAAGWLGMLAFGAAAVSGIAFLRTSNLDWDIVSMAAVELGLIFSFLNIITGSVWARGSWGTWWDWDPRLVTATIMELIYAAYLMLRQGIDNPVRRARFGAVYALLGFASVPLTYFSIRIWRTIHPVVIAGASGDDTFAMTERMKLTFFFALFVFTVLFIDLMWHRIRLGRLSDKVENLRLKSML